MGSDQSSTSTICTTTHCEPEICEVRARQKACCKDMATIQAARAQRALEDENQSTSEAIIQAKIEYEDDANDSVRFQLQPGGILVMFVNGRRTNGGKESSGIITTLSWTPKPGYGGVIRTQHHFGGAIPELQLEELRAMAVAAGVQHNIPWDLDDPEAPDPLPAAERFQLAGRITIAPDLPLFAESIGRFMPGESTG